MGIEERFCKNCGLGFLDDHPDTFGKYMKCRTCAYTVEKDLEAHKKIIEKQDTRNYKSVNF